jgi:hypothetical protein
MVTTGQAGQRIFALARAVGWVFPVEFGVPPIYVPGAMRVGVNGCLAG